MITPRLIFQIFLILLAFFMNHMGRWPFLQPLMILLILLPVVSFLLGLYVKRNLKIQLRTENEMVERGSIARWIIYLANPSALFTVFCHARLRSARLYPEQPYRDADFMLPRKSDRSILFEHSAAHCGPLELSYLELWMKDPLGFFYFKLIDKKNIDSLEKIYVVPQKIDLIARAEAHEMQLEDGAFIAKKSLSEIDEIDKMRPMEAGDRLKSIHWKLSARVQDWMVKQYEKAEERHVLFLVDLPRVKPNVNQPVDTDALDLRDMILEHAATYMERFLLQDYVVKLKVYLSDTDEVTAQDMTEHDLLRQMLGRLPLDREDSLDTQLQDELLNPEKKLFFVLTHDLEASSVGLLTLLRKENAGIILCYFTADEMPPENQDYLMDLKNHDIKLVLMDRYGQPVEEPDYEA